MTNLSSPIGELRSNYRVIVVGSGYGGAIAAYRMAEKLLDDERGSVCVLERGIERQAGDFPSTFASAVQQIQVDTRGGRIGKRTSLFDFRVNRDVSVLVGCGLGGTSLINAGVMLKPHESVWADEAWPEALKNHPQALKTEFASVIDALSAEPCPDQVPLRKVEQLFAAGRAAVPKTTKTRWPRIAVSFTTGDNQFGVHQRRCTLCGDCLTGCNHDAKNTVQMNYLPAAVKEGAAIFCGIEVRSIERGESDEWLVHIRILDRPWQRFGSHELTLRAGAVFLAAGTLGSTEILLRSRAHHKMTFSPKLGERFSGNGDAIAFGYNCPETVNGIGYGRVLPIETSVGPTIAGMLDERNADGGLMIQEGAIPGALALPLRFTAPIISRVTRLHGDLSFDLSFRHIWRELYSLVRGAKHGALARTQTFLVMSRDKGDGKLRLARDRVRVDWPLGGEQPVFSRIAKRLSQLTKAMRGRYVINPFWSRLFGRRLLTVHPLGGCAMADTAECGVVNDLGQVFDGNGGVYPNLYVCDGAIIPTPLGANPALTISALAERIAAHAPLPEPRRAAAGRARRTAAVSRQEVGRPPWTMEGIAVDDSPSRTDPTAAGIRYAERMRGWMTLAGTRTRLELMLHVSAESANALLTGSAHSASIVGVARTPDYDIKRWTVSHSTMNVLVTDPRAVDTRLIVYRLKLTSERGDCSVWIRGHKTINLENCRKGTWRAISYLSFVAYTTKREPTILPDSNDFADLCNWVEHCRAPQSAEFQSSESPDDALPDEGLVGRGLVRNSVPDVLRFVASMDVMYERHWTRRARILLRYAYYFADAVFQARVWPLQRTAHVSPFTRPKLELKRADSQELDKRTDGPPRFLLSQYGAENGGLPVIVAPGFGMSADSFLVGEPSFVDYLLGKGYQVWLLDYRASDHLDISLTQFSVDDLVGDFRDAIKRVSQLTNQKVRIVAHCVASLATIMTLLKREDVAPVVQSVVLSQSFPFIDYPLTNRVKAWIRLPQLLKILGFRPMLTTDFDVRSDRGTQLLDWLLRLYPTNEHCSSGVCRRILLLYGEVLRHDQLDHKTHDDLYDLFDRATFGVFEHVSCMVRKGHIVDVNGGNTYLTSENGRHLTMPITLIHGELNRLFRPPGAYRTHAWLRQNGFNGDPVENKERFVRTEVPGYAHLDHFIGKNAARDVFPIVVSALERMEKIRSDE